MRLLHQRYTLYSERNDTYIFVPEGEAQSLTIHRTSGDIVLNSPQYTLPYAVQRSEKVIYGILGLISLTLSEYVIVLTGRTLQGQFMGHDIYRATEFDILPLAAVSTYVPPHAVEAHLLGLVRSHLNSGNFLFSYTYDLTRRLQMQWETREADAGRALWEVMDDRFFWNRFLHTKFIEQASSNPNVAFGSFILPIMYGTFDIRPTFLHGRHMHLALISRRSRYRAGTRYFRRGIDQNGNVANFNETEQILLVEGQAAPGPVHVDDDTFATKLSHVQIRGSVPVFWSEINTLRYKPDLQIMDLQETPSVMHAHLSKLSKIYGQQSLVNLVNMKGREKPVKEAYERYISGLDLSGVNYQYFDFHGECKHMRWDRISVLIDRLKDELDNYGYFQVNNGEPSPRKIQNGIVRTNCMDNLDRTNVVQAAVAKYVLNQQLQSLGILSSGDGIDDFEAFSKEFRELWADHADSIAKAYGGSGALKSDFTRTNKRTRKGVLEDGYKSVMRYLKNNFFDGARQDGFDLVTGSWVPRKNPSASLFLISDPRPLITRSMPATAWFSVFMICAGLTLPRTSDYSLFYYFLLWFTLFSIAVAYIIIHGIDYVSWPRLLPPTDIIYYTGPGFRSGHHGKGLKGVNEPSWKKTKWLPVGGKRGVDAEVELGTIKKRVD
ncbi:inositol/phosphatidylinositol phosphatase [Gymnopilus junonius]|uniref:Inositol/phosphatidylinositol phosphatase n=1 Tax=Gymnopilus junonius TaxID=109634 RepID=A0A9P5NSQ1_GYMJU|nr:inositol/phosphatidylinositol phosphatase [Gymnopilus junonius]